LRILKPGALLAALILLVFIAGCGGQKKEAEKWPAENIKVIVPFGAGGSVDRMARGLTTYWAKELGVSMVVDNKSGAGGMLGASEFVKAAPDGQTIFMGVQPSLSFNIALQNAGFKLEDFVFLNIEQIDFADVIVPTDSPYKTFDDLHKDVMANPGKLSMGAVLGNGTGLLGVVLSDVMGWKVRTVTYNSGGGVRTAIIGKQVDFAVSGASSDLTLGDKMRVLAVASKKPVAIFPDSPTVDSVVARHNKTLGKEIGDSRFIAVHKAFVDKYPERWKKLKETYEKTYNSQEYQSYLKTQKLDTISAMLGPEKSMEFMKGQHEVVNTYKHLLTGW